MDTPAATSGTAPAGMNLPSLVAGLLIMVGGTLYPPLMAGAGGKADHALAMALLWAMSAGFVRGVGFVPRQWIWRVVFSGWACVATLLLAAVLKLQR